MRRNPLLSAMDEHYCAYPGSSGFGGLHEIWHADLANAFTR